MREGGKKKEEACKMEGRGLRAEKENGNDCGRTGRRTRAGKMRARRSKRSNKREQRED